MTRPTDASSTATPATTAAAATARRVLCAVDFSPAARGALLRAIELTKPAGSVLTLIHVVASPFAGGLGGDAARYFSAAAEAAAAALTEWKAQALAEGCPTVETVHVTGVPWERIVGRALEHRDDLVVLGTHGRTGLAHAMLGSVAERVLRHAPCSVLVTRQAASPPARDER